MSNDKNFSEGKFNTLVNPDASTEAKALINYLNSIYGTGILAGQQEWCRIDPPEIDYIYNITGKMPAIRALDYLHYSPSVNRPDGVTERAIDWYKNKKGIVTICWHWFAPLDGASFYTKDTKFDIEKAVTPGTRENELIFRDMDRIAEELKILRDESVPVIWRPLHEADGKWFWWGAKGPEPCKKLYWLMYERFTEYHKLNNLIWAWTFATNIPALDWYPGDEKVDIVGIDKYYQAGDFNPNAEGYNNLKKTFDDKKMMAMLENGPLPDPDRILEEGTGWLWFCTWWGGFVMDEEKVSHEVLNKIYNHPYVITLDKLPQLK